MDIGCAVEWSSGQNWIFVAQFPLSIFAATNESSGRKGKLERCTYNSEKLHNHPEGYLFHYEVYLARNLLEYDKTRTPTTNRQRQSLPEHNSTPVELLSNEG
ncbi:hypothetical protein NPIL_163921 [Nephila pilipes]|uniref:Uncharacterized protein n=1 Tax=Nephila pilipes TaxID=299642 RepID=A0A8X6NMV6_NEPPI|nr:hypothetical protein NPIL_163921 [Nephila pilipes]